MNAHQVADLLYCHQKLSEYGLFDAAKRINNVLAEEVPEGVNVEVDLALGRATAKLPERVTYGVSDALLFAADQHDDMLDWRWSQGQID